MDFNPYDKMPIVIDIGLRLTKAGFAGEPAPRCVVQTPLSAINLLRQGTVRSLGAALEGQGLDTLKKEFHLLFKHLFHERLLVNPKQTPIVVTEMVIRSRLITDAIGSVLFDKFGVYEVYFVVGNVLPLYCSDYDTGLVVECGFTHLQILPISQGIIDFKGFQAADLGMFALEQEVLKKLAVDNKRIIKELTTKSGTPPEVTPKIAEDMITRTLFVPSRTHLEQFTAEESEVKTMQKSRYTFTFYSSILPTFKISYAARMLSTQVFFGKTDEDPNIARLILQSLSKMAHETRVKVCQNIILSGGTFTIPGFKRRLLEEILYLIDKEFPLLESIKWMIRFAPSPFAPNLLIWVGCSILASMSDCLANFKVKREDYIASGGHVPDRIGEAFLFGRVGVDQASSIHFNEKGRLELQKLRVNRNTLGRSSIGLRRSGRFSLRSSMKRNK